MANRSTVAACIAFAVSVSILTLFLALECSASEIQSFGTDLSWHYHGEVVDTPHYGKFCGYVGSRHVCAHGNGFVGTEGGEDYKGTFVSGEMDGFGTYESAVVTYVGAFKNGRFNGHGVLECFRSDGRFEGMFIDGKMSDQNRVPLRPNGARILLPEDYAVWLSACRYR